MSKYGEPYGVYCRLCGPKADRRAAASILGIPHEALDKVRELMEALKNHRAAQASYCGYISENDREKLMDALDEADARLEDAIDDLGELLTKQVTK